MTGGIVQRWPGRPICAKYPGFGRLDPVAQEVADAAAERARLVALWKKGQCHQ
jgi:hypothetical protein